MRTRTDTMNIGRHSEWIGDFSYPVYISHFLFIKIALILLPKLGIPQSLLSLIVLLSTCVFSYILIELVGNRIERYRAGRIKNQQHQNKSCLNTLKV
jgi:peptidoglycan/LPS O-acetylase OafA/YrhL